MKSPSKKLASRPPWPGLASIRLILTRRVNFAWITAGGRAISCYGEPDSPVYLVLTPKGKWAVGYAIDLPRTADEELAGLGYEPVALPSFGKTLPEAVAELTVGPGRGGWPVPRRCRTSARRSASCTSRYTPEEMARYAEAAQTERPHHRRDRPLGAARHDRTPGDGGDLEAVHRGRPRGTLYVPGQRRAHPQVSPRRVHRQADRALRAAGALHRALGPRRAGSAAWSISASRRPTSGAVSWPWRRCRPRCWRPSAPAFP